MNPMHRTVHFTRRNIRWFQAGDNHVVVSRSSLFGAGVLLPCPGRLLLVFLWSRSVPLDHERNFALGVNVGRIWLLHRNGGLKPQRPPPPRVIELTVNENGKAIPEGGFVLGLSAP